MTDRPLFRSTIDQLESLFREDQGIESLKKLKDELQFRSTQRATILLRKVDAEIKAFIAKAQPLNLNRPLEEKNNPTDFPGSNPAHTTPATENVQPPSTDARMQNGEDAGSKIRVLASGLPISASQYDRKSVEIDTKQNSSEKPASDNHSRLLDLLEYLEHLAKLGEKPIFTLKEYQQLVFSEADLKGQIGITHDVSADGEQVA